MAEVTIGQVAGIIAAALVAVQIIAPLVIAYVLLGALRDSESAITWSVVNQKVQATLWPLLLRQESVRATGVRGVIRSLTTAFPVLAVLAAIAGIITPLGLGEELRPLNPTRVDFEYARDPGPFYLGTSPRGVVELSRTCSEGVGLFAVPLACPYTGDQITVERDGNTTEYSWPDGGRTTKVPDILREIFSSGTKGTRSTVSNYFDIEWRQVSSATDTKLNDGKPYGMGIYRQLDSFILQDRYHVIEGLVVDSRVGGIGFRNHTVPSGLRRGATWQEDLLFIEPEAACVNTNLTFEFTIMFDDDTETSHGTRDLVLVDRGGFVDLNTTYPDYDHDNAQNNPDLVNRAYKAAYLNNVMTMMILNVSNPNVEELNLTSFSYMNSERGRKFPVATSLNGYTALGIFNTFGKYLELVNGNTSSFADNVPDYPNPYNFTEDDFATINTICNGAGNADQSNITNIYSNCGLLRGAPVRTDGGLPSLMEHGSKWKSPLHACSTAIKATIKTVTFEYNNTETEGLQGLTVTNVEDKKYDSEDDHPIWGMEDSGMGIENISPIWGLITEEYANRPNVSSVRKPDFYLPGLASTVFQVGMIGRQTYNIPASDFYSRAMDSVFQLNEGNEWPFDLTGAASMALFTRWQELSPDPLRAADIIKLLWTDIAASAVVGTKGVLGAFNGGASDEVADVPVSPVGRYITYNYLYGIPAFILSLFLALLFTVLLFSMCFGKASMFVLKRRYTQISPGRIFTTFLYPDQSNLTMPVDRWMSNNAEKNINVGVFANRLTKPLASAMDQTHFANISTPQVDGVGGI